MPSVFVSGVCTGQTQNLMFVGTGAGGGVLVVVPNEGEIVRDDDVPAAEVPAVVPAGGVAVEGKRPQSDEVGVGVGAACSISRGSSADSAGAALVEALGAAAAEAGGGSGAAETVGSADAAGVGFVATSPSCARMTNTPTAPIKSTASAVIAATAPLDIRRPLFTGTEIGAAALMLALTADVGACGCDG
ncbi:MAG TPA: hypothetical protein PK156_34350 [Polyangium sp.]|nr:hypothetical protein [Polyangium sp.]